MSWLGMLIGAAIGAPILFFLFHFSWLEIALVTPLAIGVTLLRGWLIRRAARRDAS